MKLDGVGKKSGIKLTVYSLQNAVCCSAVIFYEGLPCGAEWVRVLQGRTQQWNPLPCPRCPEPASIHHHSYWKKGRGHLCRAQWLGDGGSFEAPPRIFRIKYFSIISRDYVLSKSKLFSDLLKLYLETISKLYMILFCRDTKTNVDKCDFQYIWINF